MGNITFKYPYEHTIRHGVVVAGFMLAFCLFILTLIFLLCSTPPWLFGYVKTKIIILYLILNVSSIVYMIVVIVLDFILRKFYDKEED